MFDKSIAANPPTVDYERVMEADGIAEWTRQIVSFISRLLVTRKLIEKNTYGLSFVRNCPIDPEATKKLLEKIGPIRETHYG
jgi:trimethyllysine dioxygenase